VKARLAAMTLALVLAACVASGCSASPAPAESTPAFPTEEEAFAAAEETYRAYVDALNTRRDDPSSEPDPEDFLSGQALQVDFDTQQQLAEAGLSISGRTAITHLEPDSASADLSTVVVSVCLDSSQTRVLNADGEDVTPADRVSLTPVVVTLESLGSTFLIIDSETGSSIPC
jgi:hypothetical protein